MPQYLFCLETQLAVSVEFLINDLGWIAAIMVKEYLWVCVCVILVKFLLKILIIFNIVDAGVFLTFVNITINFFLVIHF